MLLFLNLTPSQQSSAPLHVRGRIIPIPGTIRIFPYDNGTLIIVKGADAAAEVCIASRFLDAESLNLIDGACLEIDANHVLGALAWVAEEVVVGSYGDGSVRDRLDRDGKIPGMRGVVHTCRGSQ